MKTLMWTFLLTAFSAVASAQQVDALNLLRLAQEFESTGAWERAMHVYEELHLADTSNLVYYDGLVRSCVQLKEYDRAIALVGQRLVIQPRDPALLCTLAGLHYDAGREATADSVWNAALGSDRRNAALFHLVASEMLEHRLYDKAIHTYLAGRVSSGDDAAFASELANLYAILQRYPQATAEYLLRLRRSPDQLAFVQSQIAAFFTKPQALEQAAVVVRTEVERMPRDIPVRRFLAWLESENHEYDAALIEYDRIDELVNANGGELASFAQRMQLEHAHRQAAAAYRLLLSRPIDRALVPMCRFGEARAIEDLSADTSAVPSAACPSPADAVCLYERVAADYGGTDLAAQATYRIGLIRLNRFFDLNGAGEAFARVREMPRRNTLPLDAALRMGEVDVARNDLVRARADFAMVWHEPFATYRDQALFRLAELDYFEGRFDSSLARLARFKTDVSGDLANDALMLLYFIQENIGGPPEALTAFARADLLVRQRKLSEAFEQFRNLVARFPQALLSDDAQMRLGEIAVALGRSSEALSAFHVVADSMTTSIWKDRARFRIGEVYDRLLRDIPRAIEAYENLLADFPTSLFADEARSRIRLLRGDRR